MGSGRRCIDPPRVALPSYHQLQFSSLSGWVRDCSVGGQGGDIPPAWALANEPERHTPLGGPPHGHQGGQSPIDVVHLLYREPRLTPRDGCAVGLYVDESVAETCSLARTSGGAEFSMPRLRCSGLVLPQPARRLRLFRCHWEAVDVAPLHESVDDDIRSARRDGSTD